MADGAGKVGRRRQEDQRRAAELKKHRVERTTARCPVCYRLVSADMLRHGMAGHRCGRDE